MLYFPFHYILCVTLIIDTVKWSVWAIELLVTDSIIISIMISIIISSTFIFNKILSDGG